ncbi:MAG: hypothetical protein WCF85_10795 [Rhodospirillaceae bacterium]
MSISIGSGQASVQFLQTGANGSAQSLQALRDNQQQAADSMLRRVTKNTSTIQENAVTAFREQGKRGAAIDLSV